MLAGKTDNCVISEIKVLKEKGGWGLAMFAINACVTTKKEKEKKKK